MRKLCLIFNTAPLYRTKIYCDIDKTYDCDWYFGPKRGDIKVMDYSLLKNVHFLNLYGNPNRLCWKTGMLKLLFNRNYDTFLMYPEVHSFTDWIFFFIAFTLFPKKKIYLWTHGWYGKESKIVASLKRWLSNNATGILSYSNYARNLMIEQGIASEKIVTIHNSLDYDRQIELRKGLQPSPIFRQHFGNNNPVIIFIGRLTKVKHLDLLIDAINLLRNNSKSYNVVIVGNGEEKESLMNQVTKYGLSDNVWFYGACYDEKTNAELIYNADLCVAPGNVGLTAMHTMVFGTPVISHNDFKWQMPEFEAIIPERTGAFFSKGDVDSLAESINKWFESHSSDRDSVRLQCYHEIDTQWNPAFQMNAINQLIGLPQ